MDRGQARGSARGGRGSANRGQGRGNPRDGRHSQPPVRRSPQGGAGIYEPSANDFSGNKEGSSKGDMGSPQEMFPRSFSKNPEHKPTSSSEYRKEWPPADKKYLRSNAERLKEGSNSTESSDASDSGHKGDFSSLSTLNLSQNLHEEAQGMQIGETPSKRTGDSETHLPSKSEAKHGYIPIKSPLPTSSHQKPELSEHSAVDSSFDLCPTKAGSAVTLKPSLLVQNREKRNEIKRSMEQPSESVLRSGMVLLKSFISLNDQIKIVKLCRDLGLGRGGFYQPGYRDGAKLNLRMMCLGKNWDPETSQYGDHRPHDDAKPPSIPVDFLQLVKDAMKDILPPVSPDICLVNFYSSTGRLGLHQDRDESDQSLHKGLPVVSFSIGDAAEFLYGDQRDVESANKVILESGDVLIFGGKSRHIFHGVASIQPNTAPKTLLEVTNLRPGIWNCDNSQYKLSLAHPDRSDELGRTEAAGFHGNKSLSLKLSRRPSCNVSGNKYICI